MQKMFITLFAATLTFVWAHSSPILAQDATAKGFMGGLNIANFYGPDAEMDNIAPSPRMGFTAGAFLVYGFIGNIGIRVEILYSQKGAEYESRDEKLTFSFNYLEIPSLFQFSIPTEGAITPILFIGPTLGIKLSAKAKAEPEGESEEEDVEDMARTDFGIIFGAGIFVFDRFDISIRYNLGLSRIFYEEYVDKKNRVVSIMAGIHL